ncbi:centromere protein P [Lates japonicus]|uniref:Centromere protein P n=1 Tax=Lates japonicus TaxID=270547 RepID=A0AAD3MQK6_LATJO|nr:centromere protein P [Lates japonicus]
MEEKVSEENTEEVKMLEAQIDHLQAEVAALQRQQRENYKDMTFNFQGHMQDALSYMCGERPVGGKEKVVSRLKEEVEELEDDLKRQTQMNGISLNSCTTKTLQRSSRKLVQQVYVSGHCSELVFQVEFQLSEVKEGQRSERTISDLNVVMDASDLQNFSSFLSG